MVEESAALVLALEERGIVLRLLGGAGVVLRCQPGPGMTPHRTLGDIDGATRRSDARELKSALVDRGYHPDGRFNALHGDRRMIFHGPAGKLDVFVGQFDMCHRIELEHRLELDSPVLPVSDLLITKLQVVELNAKDAEDAALLLRHHEFADNRPDALDASYLAELVGQDWGLWRTATGTLERLSGMDPSIASKARALTEAFDAAPKTRRFRMRERVGERKRWYQLPEDV